MFSNTNNNNSLIFLDTYAKCIFYIMLSTFSIIDLTIALKVSYQILFHFNKLLNYN